MLLSVFHNDEHATNEISYLCFLVYMLESLRSRHKE